MPGITEQTIEHINTLNPIEKTALSQFVTQVKTKLGKENLQLFLFGSKARGDFDKESDLDLLIIVSDKVNLSDTKKIIRNIAGDISLHYAILIINVIVSNFEFTYKSDYSFFDIIRSEGIPL